MTEAPTSPTVHHPMPVLFVGHGSPMNAIEDNRWSRGFTALGAELPRPAAVLAVSAHWYVDGTFLTGQARPPTLHDFGGFPRALYEVRYPSPGQPELAQRVRRMLGEARAALDEQWGIDHGSWSVLRWMYPGAQVPVIQLSIDRRLDARRHFELGRSLAALREEGVLILASGNIVHNLRDAFTRMRAGNTDTPAWAARFDAEVRDTLQDRDWARLLDLASDTDDGRQAHPTPDHWLPLLYAAGAAAETPDVAFTSEGFDLGSLSMRNVIFR